MQRDGVRTYKARRGRMSASKADALTRLRPAFGVPVDGRPLDLAALFGRTAPVVLEIGSGMGEATARMAADDPGRDVLAVEVHTPGVATLLELVEAGGLRNVRVAEGDALVVLRDMLALEALDEVRVLFPDPWPKARHAKRRLIRPDVVELLASRLRPDGVLHLATDSAAYAEQAIEAVTRSPLLDGGARARPALRPVTRFEQQALDAGRTAVDVVAVRQPGGATMATSSTCSVIGNRSNARSEPSAQPASSSTRRSRANDAGSHAT